jgi:hypothetical protein
MMTNSKIAFFIVVFSDLMDEMCQSSLKSSFRQGLRGMLWICKRYSWNPRNLCLEICHNEKHSYTFDTALFN